MTKCAPWSREAPELSVVTFWRNQISRAGLMSFRLSLWTFNKFVGGNVGAFPPRSRAAPQTVKTASPVCGTKNFSSVRLYSAPQLHCTIVAILGICISDRRSSSPELCHSRTDPLLRRQRFQTKNHLRKPVSRELSLSKLSSGLPRLLSAPRLGATVCFSRLELTLHGSPAVFLAADVVVLPLRTRH
jgi:hypothetical protein